MSWSDAYVSIGGVLSGSVCPVQKYPFQNRVLAYNDTASAHSNAVSGEPGPLRISIPYTGYADVSIDKTLLAVFPQYDSETGTIIRWLRVYYSYENRVSFSKPEVAFRIWLAGYEISTGEYAIADSQESIVTAPGYVDYMFDLYMYICGGTVPGEDYKFYGVGISAYSQTLEQYSWGYVLTTDRRLQTGDIPERHDFSPEFGPASEPEGYETPGGYDDHSDVIGLPPLPQSILSLGFLNVYKCASSALVDFGAALFPEINFPQSLSDVGEVLAAVSDSIWNSKLIDYVVDVHVVPGDVSAGALEDIKVGARTMTGILARKITSEYVDFDFGSVSVPPYFKNYVDYMTEIQLYLPMYGFISLKPEEIIGGAVKVVYRFNVIDGSFQAFVFATSNRSKLAQSLIGQYGGSCIVHLPVSNLSYASMFSSMIGGAATAAMGVASGGAGAALAGALTATNMATQAVQGGDTKKSNSYNASAAYMSRMQPYLIVTRPQPSFSTRYNIENGFPSNITYTIGQCSGFTIAENAILDGIPATLDEKARIAQYLKSGVIIK